jgi:hypothetical protein
MKLTKNFWLWEFMHPDIFYQHPASICLGLLDFRVIKTAQFIRDRHGKRVTINTWKNGGEYLSSGFRPYFDKTGVKLSQHKFGRAADLKIEDIDPEEIREDIKKNFIEFRKNGLTTIENDTPTWLHFDCRITKRDTLFEIDYK